MASGTEFLVNIRAQVQGSGMSELQTMQANAKQAIDKYAELERASVKLSGALEKVQASSAAVAGKMQAAMEAGDGNAFWKLAGEANALATKEAALKSKLAATNSAMDAQAQAAKVAANALDDFNARAKGAADETAKFDTQKAAGGIKKLGGPLGGVGDKIEEFSESWEALSGSLGKSGAAFAVAGVAAVALIAVLAAGAVKVAAMAVGLADTKRNASLTMEAFAGSAEAGAKLSAAISEVSNATGVGSERLLELSRDLKTAGVSAADMPAALKAIAMQEKALDDTGGTAALIEDLKTGKKAAGELASEMESKFGGVVQKKLLGLDSQWDKFQRNIAGTFGGLGIEGLLAGLATLVALFDSNTESGRALKSLFEGIFQPFISGVGNAATVAEAFFLGAVIAALKVGIAVKNLANQFDFDLGGIVEMPSAAAIGEVAMYMVVAAVGVLAAGVAVVAAGVSLLITTWTALSAGATAAWNAITTAADSAIEKLKGMSLADIGKAMLEGLAKGITGAASLVTDALGGVVTGAIDSAKSKLGIASPSKVFAELGGYTGEGFAVGIDDSASMVQSAMTDLVEPPEAKAAKAGAAGGGGTITATFNLYPTGLTETLAQVEQALDDLIERKALAMGAA